MKKLIEYFAKQGIFRPLKEGADPGTPFYIWTIDNSKRKLCQTRKVIFKENTCVWMGIEVNSQRDFELTCLFKIEIRINKANPCPVADPVGF